MNNNALVFYRDDQVTFKHGTMPMYLLRGGWSNMKVPGPSVDILKVKSHKGPIVGLCECGSLRGNKRK